MQTFSRRAGVASSVTLLVRSGRVLSIGASSAILRSAKGMIAAARDSSVKVPGLVCHPCGPFIGDDGARNYAGGSDGRIAVARSARNQASRASSVAFALVIFSCSLPSPRVHPSLCRAPPRRPPSPLPLSTAAPSRIVGAMWVENFSGAGRRLVTHLGVIKSAPAPPSARATPSLPTPYTRVYSRCYGSPLQKQPLRSPLSRNFIIMHKSSLPFINARAPVPGGGFSGLVPWRGSREFVTEKEGRRGTRWLLWRQSREFTSGRNAAEYFENLLFPLEDGRKGGGGGIYYNE